MKVLFLSPPMKDYGHYGSNVIPYTEHAMYAAFLAQYAPEVEIDLLECPAHRITTAQLVDEIHRRSPDVVVTGILYAPQDEDVQEGFRLIKSISPDIITVAEGPHFSGIPRESMQACPEIDFITVGEAEGTLLELVQSVNRNGHSYGHIKGLAWRDHGNVIVNSPRPFIKNLDDLPRPAYHLLDLDKNLYRQLVILDRYVRVYSSRGCKARCEFCHRWPQFDGTYRTRSGRSMAEEVMHLHETYGIKTFEFYDADFGEDAIMVENFCNTLLKKQYDINLWVLTRADNVIGWHARRLLPKLRDAGLRLAAVGVEYYTDEKLKTMGKRTTTAEIRTAFRLLREAGIASVGLSILGWWDETPETAEALYDYIVDDIQADFLGMMILQPLPGTLLWRQVKDEPWLLKEYKLYDRYRPVMPSQVMTREEIARKYVEFHKRFYFDPARTDHWLESDNDIARATVHFFRGRFGQTGGQGQVQSNRMS